jgi:hypothetical protein
MPLLDWMTPLFLIEKPRTHTYLVRYATRQPDRGLGYGADDLAGTDASGNATFI